MTIIVGLGNIGREYEDTFHNLGFAVVDFLAKKLGIAFSKEKFKAVIAEGRYNGEAIMLVKPTTYMNNSGECLVMLKKKYKDARIIVVVDDIDLKKGIVRYRLRGSSGTHNGLRSIVEYIGEEFERVKIGAGRDVSKDLADYVLSKLNHEDHALLDDAIEKGANLILEQIS